jgi:cytoskeleton protein RodZ
MHSEQTSAEGVSAAGGIGRRLALAREARGLSVGDAAQALKLTLRQVEALEEERFERLPGTAFARGFLRNYARLVQLDPEPLIAEFDTAHADAGVELRQLSNARGAMPSGGRGRGPSALPAALFAAVLLAIVVTGWYFDWFRQPEAERPGLTSDPAPGPSPVPGPAAAEGERPAGVAVTVVPTEAGAFPGTSLVATPEPPPAAAPATGPAPAEAVPAAGPDGLQRLAFGFDQDAWVEVRDASGAIIFSRIGKAGSSQEVQGRGPFAVVVGNAQNVRLSQNGKAVDLAPHTQVSVARLTLQ